MERRRGDMKKSKWKRDIRGEVMKMKEYQDKEMQKNKIGDEEEWKEARKGNERRQEIKATGR